MNGKPKLTSFILAGVFSLLLPAILFSSESLKIKHAEIPLPEEAIFQKKELDPQEQAEIFTYIVKKPFEEIVLFYEAYFQENDFSVIGGIGETGYDAAVKKGDLMFSIRISPDWEKTVIEFIW